MGPPQPSPTLKSPTVALSNGGYMLTSSTRTHPTPNPAHPTPQLGEG